MYALLLGDGDACSKISSKLFAVLRLNGIIVSAHHTLHDFLLNLSTFSNLQTFCNLQLPVCKWKHKSVVHLSF